MQTAHEQLVLEFLPAPHQMGLAIKQSVVSYSLNANKSPGYDLINGCIVKELHPESLDLQID